MAVINNTSVIPFYESAELQDFRSWWAWGEYYMLYASRNSLLPFYFQMSGIESTDTTSIENVEIYKLCCRPLKPYFQGGDYNLDFSNDFLIYRSASDEYHWKDSLGAVISNDTIVYYGTPEEDLDLEKGVYYLKFIINVNDEQREYFSDAFVAMDDSELSRFLKIEWYNHENLEMSDGNTIPYYINSTQFKNLLYLDTDIALPSYEFEEEGENRGGYFFPIRQISYKRYQFTFVAPEYLCDVMRLIRLSDEVEITDRPEPRNVHRATQFLMTTEWLEQGHYAKVQCEFTTNTVVKMIGKAITIM